jgi:hypothetical protein
MTMELDELKQAWKELDLRQDGMETLLRADIRERRVHRLRRGLRPLVWGQAAQMAFGVAAMLWGVTFWSTHLGQGRAMACGIAIQVFGILMIAFAAKLLFSLRGIDYAAPVLDIQRRLAAMRVWRVRVEAPLFVLLGSFMWIPAVLMLLLGDADRVGIDLWRVLPGLTTWLALNGALALSLALVVYWLLRRSGRVPWLENNFAGSAIRRAEAALEDVARFERE